MMKDMPPSHWPVGRVLETDGGSNDVVPAMKLDAASDRMIRTASKTALLAASLDCSFVRIRLLGREDVTSFVTVTLRTKTLWHSIKTSK